MTHDDLFHAITSDGVPDHAARKVIGRLRREGLVLVKAGWRERMQRLENVIEEIAKGVVNDG